MQVRREDEIYELVVNGDAELRVAKNLTCRQNDKQHKARDSASRNATTVASE